MYCNCIDACFTRKDLINLNKYQNQEHFNPATNAVTEHSGSTLRRLIIFLRKSMSQRRPNNLKLLKIKND